jgi:hypothetical protein
MAARYTPASRTETALVEARRLVAGAMSNKKRVKRQGFMAEFRAGWREGSARAAAECDPVARARQAHLEGERIFQLVLDVQERSAALGPPAWTAGDMTLTRTSDHGPTIAAVEAVGWRLDKMEHIWAQTGETSRDKGWPLTGQLSTTSGKVVGVYLFRRTR